MVPAPTLPMLLPLTDIGVPKPIVDALNSLLQPIVNEGYSSLTPDAGPYFSHGSLVGLPTAADVVGSVQRDLVGSLFG
ncbi:PE-PPE domain-containing protein [Mycobacterium attenuatum]|uniref:PE-PPE domain-containing protein n=1 Tax=Mycobacterium attenuatum TaxID=2341086 RepID=UPI002452816B|nr:PE-PPE domain-containing protein [Mycobacterium attenuatum]